jgi:ABC-type multidrug transport system permease subunit
MRIRHGFATDNIFIINKIIKNITSLELSDEHSIKNVLMLLNSNKNVNIENVKKLIISERKKKRIIFNISRIIMIFIMLSLILLFFSNNYIIIPLFLGIICIGVAIYSTICDTKRNKYLNEMICS